jgi:hypothetical protein
MSTGRVVAEVAATSTAHRAAARKRNMGEFLGVSRSHTTGPFYARWKCGSRHHCSKFSATAVEAAKIYDRAVRDRDGWFVLRTGVLR